MKWIDDCAVGIPELDKRHNDMFERFVFVKDIMAGGAGWNDVHSALATLIKDFAFCSAVEEALMRIHDYPGYEVHKQEHADLLQSLRAMEKAVLTTGLTEEMIGTAFAATMKHHLTQDRRYSRYLPRAGWTTRMGVSG